MRKKKAQVNEMPMQLVFLILGLIGLIILILIAVNGKDIFRNLFGT
jgi:hypothetical protein